MPRTPTGDRMPCQVCQHPSRQALEQALVNGKSARDVARTFGIGSGAFGTDTFKADHKKVLGHLDRHMGPAYTQAVEAVTMESGTALVRRMDELDAAVDATLSRAIAGRVVKDENGVPLLDDDGKPLRVYPEQTILKAVSEARRNVEMRARLQGIAGDSDVEAVEAARRALTDPTLRAMVQDLEQAVHDRQAGA